MQDRQVGSNSFDKPFVSFCISCYKQEQYIADALAGAFSQTYDNMEIVISDDCSPDGTVDVIKREIAKYRESGGKLPVTLNINEKNLGNLGNWIKMGEVAKGELLIKADGDDISLPERTAKVVEAWVKDGKRAKEVTHRALKFSNDGICLGISEIPCCCFGAVAAYSHDCWKYMKPHDGEKGCTDDVFFTVFEKALGKHFIFIDEVLVYYRVGSGITTRQTSALNRALRTRVLMKNSLELALAELNDNWNCFPEGYREEAKAFAEYEIAVSGTLITLLDGKKLKDRLSAFKKLKTSGAKAFLFKCIYLLPNRPKSWLLELWDRVKKRRILRSNGEKITDFTKVPARYA